MIAWLFSGSLQTALPFWLPFAILAATEVEFVVRGWRQTRGAQVPSASDVLERRLPGAADADLGWVETTAADGTTELVPALPRARRRSALPLATGIALAVVLFACAYRVDARDGWPQRTPAERARARARVQRRGEPNRRPPGRRALRRQLFVHGSRVRCRRCRLPPPRARLSPAGDLPHAVPDPLRRKAGCARRRSARDHGACA